MKKLCVLMIIALLLCGCGAEQTFETVADEMVQQVMAQPREVSLTLPEETLLPAMESDGRTLYLCSGYDVAVQTFSGGDLDATSEAAEVQCGIAMLPIGGTYTMNPEEAAALVNKMKPEIVIPTHYGTLAGDPGDGQRFASLVDDGIRVEFKL